MLQSMEKLIDRKYDTWHAFPQYHATRQAEHFLRLLESKHPSQLEPLEILLGVDA